jgi:hypothetical protein
MTMNSQIQKLWQTHLAVPFPEGIAGEVIDGVDLVLLDTFTAGCIHTYISNNGQLDSERIRILKKCLGELDLVIQKLDGLALDRYKRARTLATLVLQEASS